MIRSVRTFIAVCVPFVFVFVYLFPQSALAKYKSDTPPSDQITVATDADTITANPFHVFMPALSTATKSTLEGIPAPNWWRPSPSPSWQWQLTTPTDLSINAEIYDVDLFDASMSTIAALKSQGRKVICYISMGSYEAWRPDAAQFPAAVIGKDYPGWPNEKWVDIRKIDLLAPVLRARMDLCKQKGFDGIEPDNINSYQQDTGFPITYQDQIIFNRWLADEAHSRNLSIGLKNDAAQVKDLLSYFDWGIIEDCYYWKSCSYYKPFTDAGKAVFEAEYTDMGFSLSQFCPQAAQNRFSAILKNRKLDGYRVPCP